MARHSESEDDVRTNSSTPAEIDRMREVDLDAVVRRQTPTRTRVIQVGVLLTLLLVVGGLVFRGYQAGQPRPEPTAVAAVDDFSMNVAIFTNVNYGALTVNGTKLNTRPPVIVTLRPGSNTLTISAPPFQPHTCTFDMSRQGVERAQCGSGSSGPPLTIGGKKASTSITIPFTVADLPAAQQRSVVAVVAQAIDGITFHTTVPAHQYIATGVDAHGHISSHLTGEQMQADIALVRQTGQEQRMDPTCVENVCAAATMSSTPSDAPGKTWTVAAFVASQWRFTTQTSASVATVATSPTSNMLDNEIAVALEYDAAQGWRAKGTPTDIFASTSSTLVVVTNLECATGMALLSAYYARDTSDGGFVIRPNGIEGCEFHLLNSSGKPVASFIWRFGVLLAADAAAHQTIPSLPVAPQAEIDAVTKQA
ncbi:MAG: hypothetical protein ACXWQR_10925 [Ktedonobacterales bacterium]